MTHANSMGLRNISIKNKQMISKFILDLPHRPVWLLTNQEFTETDTYYNWCHKLHKLNVERRKAARLIERAHSVYERLITLECIK